MKAATPDRHSKIRRHNGTPSLRSFVHLNIELLFLYGRNELKSCEQRKKKRIFKRRKKKNLPKL
jgi:hypothetical protein